MSNSTTDRAVEHIIITLDRLPLAVYREMVAHLRQVDGVKADLLPQTATDFDYLQSQVGGLRVEYPLSEDGKIKVKEILAYYENKYSS
ncbi:hypothetical protein [Geminocystis sp. NIES-3709]|uniref:hypothetical protein n=1 Tax=Geminocystis sp. NIES-3709 TaxID=1617448 RepID=UPI0005FC4546|nr:hypothetical protein [Geminocystis sp. NIES-3709]BAQ65205.1 hypothetical protein GM3709_1970 [Geminocystis sp. NIES-3709]